MPLTQHYSVKNRFIRNQWFLIRQETIFRNKTSITLRLLLSPSLRMRAIVGVYLD